jgi:hypothetical protein
MRRCSRGWRTPTRFCVMTRPEKTTITCSIILRHTTSTTTGWRRDFAIEFPPKHLFQQFSSCFRYYRRKGTKVDVKLVILITITVISAFQYYVKHSRYEEAVNYFVTVRFGDVTAATGYDHDQCDSLSRFQSIATKHSICCQARSPLTT